MGVVIAFEICQEIPTCTRGVSVQCVKTESLYWQARGKGDVLAGSRLRRFVSSNRTVSNSIAVVGSSFLWAWGFLCYLSPVLFHPTVGAGSVGLEVGFFVSQGCIVASACLLLASSSLRRFVVRRFVLAFCAILSSVLTLLLAAFVSSGCMVGIVCCGIAHGVCIPLLGIAWGARYSIGSKGMQSLVVLSFLIAYALYFVFPFAPYKGGLVCVAVMPLASWALWRIDVRNRDALVRKVDESQEKKDAGRSLAFLGELFNGSWELSGIPWRALAAVLLAAFVGNMVASAAMGFSYENADGLFRGGAFVCACIATMALVPLTSDGSSLSASAAYRLTLTFSAVGLIGILASDGSAIALCGALVQGCAFFFQVLIIVSVSRATWEKALSPLLSFSMAQAVTAAVVLAGNVVGKQVNVGDASCPGVFEWACGLAMLALFLIMVKQAANADAALPEASNAVAMSEKSECSQDENGLFSHRDEPCFDSTEVSLEEKVALFVTAFELTKRESEVFSYLSKGRSLPYIADELFVTTGTVKTHTVHIYRKLGVKSKQELIDLFEEWKKD